MIYIVLACDSILMRVCACVCVRLPPGGGASRGLRCPHDEGVAQSMPSRPAYTPPIPHPPHTSLLTPKAHIHIYIYHIVLCVLLRSMRYCARWSRGCPSRSHAKSASFPSSTRRWRTRKYAKTRGCLYSRSTAASCTRRRKF